MNKTDKEITELENILQDLILELFDCRDKRWAINRALNKAFLLGRNKKPKGEKHN